MAAGCKGRLQRIQASLRLSFCVPHCVQTTGTVPPNKNSDDGYLLYSLLPARLPSSVYNGILPPAPKGVHSVGPTLRWISSIRRECLMYLRCFFRDMPRSGAYHEKYKVQRSAGPHG